MSGDLTLGPTVACRLRRQEKAGRAATYRPFPGRRDGPKERSKKEVDEDRDHEAARGVAIRPAAGHEEGKTWQDSAIALMLVGSLPAG